MTDVTDAVCRFREIARHLWNTTRKDSATWDDRDDFDEMCAALFRSVVLRPVGLSEHSLAPSWSRSHRPQPFLKVIPAIDSGTPVLINRTTPRSGYWDDPTKSVKANEVDLGFVRFFDWDELGHRDFAYVEVVIEAFSQHPQLVGRAALIEASHVRVLVTSENAQSST